MKESPCGALTVYESFFVVFKDIYSRGGKDIYRSSGWVAETGLLISTTTSVSGFFKSVTFSVTYLYGAVLEISTHGSWLDSTFYVAFFGTVVITYTNEPLSPIFLS